MVLTKNTHKKSDGETGQSVPVSEYNLKGIPFQHVVDVNDLNFIRGNVVRDIHRAIVLKPITREKVIEVFVDEIDEKVVYVPQVQVVDKYVEVVKPVIRYKIKEVKRPVTVEKIKKVPKITEEEKIIEVPEIKYVEKYVDVPKIVHKERIVEVPLPVVRERRIPVLNISRRERFQEVDGLEYRTFNTNSELDDGSSIDAQSSLASTPINRSPPAAEREPEEVKRQIPNKEESSHDYGDSEINEGGSNLGGQASLECYSSKLVNYNSSEDALVDQLSEPSSSCDPNDKGGDRGEGENKVEIRYGANESDDEAEFPKVGELSISQSLYESEKGARQEINLERWDETSEEGDGEPSREKREAEARKKRFESRILISPRLEAELSRKLIKNMSTQMIPKTIRMVEKSRKLKEKR